MSAISQRDYEAMLACIARLNSCDSLDQFPRVALAEVPKLVGADHSTFNYVAPSVPKAIVLATFEPPDHSQREKIFAKYISDHPILKNYLTTGDGNAFKISDFQSVREYHALPLYEHFYRGLRYEDQFAFQLFAPGAELISVAVARDRRSFTERDREILNRLRPHVARAYRQVEQITLLKRALHPHEPAHSEMRVTSVLLDATDRPLHFGTQAQQWISHFFPGGSRETSRLPKIVTDWLARGRKGSPSLVCRGEALVQERQGERLRLRVIPGLSGAGRILVLGLETHGDTAYRALAGGLTRREIEVLLQVEQGKTNNEAAAALGISSLTVRTHLEHIFEKLHVPSRTAAVTQFRRACSRFRQ